MRMTMDNLNLLANVTVTDYLSRCFKALNRLGEPQIIPRGNSTTVADYSCYGANETLR